MSKRLKRKIVLTAALVFATALQGGIATNGAIAATPAHVRVTTPLLAPAPSPAPTYSPAPGATIGQNPPLAQQNRSGDHAMGSTIPLNDPTVSPGGSTTATPNATALPNVFPPGVPGLDVSGWQTTIDWNQVWANGARFAYVKATEGVSHTSSRFSAQYTESYGVGMIRGAYHFAIPNISDGPTQAAYFVRNGGAWRSDGRTLPPLLDIEYDPYTSSDGTNICYGLSQPQMVQWISDFSSSVQNLTGIAPAIYTTTGWWTQCTGGSTLFSANPLFIARYPSSISVGPGTLPASWTRYAMWQYADSGTFPGDQDIFNGDWPALQSLALGGSVALAQPVIGVGDLNGDGKPDLLARKPEGTLWFYAGTGVSPSGGPGYAAGVQIATGWQIYDAIVGVGDLTGDGHPDILARRPDGTLWLYAGTGATTGMSSMGLLPGVQIGSGWNMFTDVIAAGDQSGDGKVDIEGRTADGRLVLYRGLGSAGSPTTGYLQPGVQIGTGWNVFAQVVGVGDFIHNGRDNLIGMKPDGTMWFYQSSGTSYAAGSELAPTVDGSSLLIAGGDTNGDGYPDLLSRSSDGTLRYYAGNLAPRPAYTPGQQVGSGWSGFRLMIGAGDIDSDGKPDLVAIGTDGGLWFYQGNGSIGGVNQSYRNGVKIGSGWGVFPKVFDAGDFTGGGHRDLIGVRNDGSLWVYPGTGTATASGNAYAAPIQIGSSGWGVFTKLVVGDFSGDGQADILATRPDGSMWLYPGLPHSAAQNNWFGQPVLAGSDNWSGYSDLASSGDSNGDGRADIIARKPDGSLWFFGGNGVMSASNPGYGTSTQIGSGWNMFASVTGTGDTNPGRTGDLLAIASNGGLWYYASTSMAGTKVPNASAALIAGSGWGIFG
jgi:GH25 family lysozyme M1 (1,4-beta-N-acetylmuramidase)